MNEKHHKLKKIEPIIASLILISGLAMLGWVITNYIINSNAEKVPFDNRVSAVFYENSENQSSQEEPHEEELNLSIASDGTRIIKRYEIFSDVILTADSNGTTVLVNAQGKKVADTIIITDIGERITATSTSEGVVFENQGRVVSGFMLDDFIFYIDEKGYMTINGYRMISDSSAVPVTTTVVTTTEPVETDEKGKPVTTPPITDDKGNLVTTSIDKTKVTTTSEKQSETKPQTTTVSRPVTTTVTTAGTTNPVTTVKEDDYYTDDEYISEVINLINAQRDKNKLKELKGQISLDKLAQIRAKEISRADSFNHYLADTQLWHSLLDTKNINYYFAGENIAAGQADPKELVDEFIKNPDAKNNILNEDFDCLGVGYSKHKGVYYWTILFISTPK